jgi:hypothetical protein
MVADHLAENDLIGDSVERLTSTTEINIRPNPDGTFKASLFEGEWNVLVPPEFNLPPFGSFGLGRPVVNSSLKVTRKEHAELKIFVQAPNGKPVKVRGRLDGLDGLSFVPGTATVSLTASRYAEVWNAAVRNDGTFEFPSVFPGLYALRLNAPGVSADVCIPVTAKEGGTNDIVFPVPVPEATPDKLQIISAIFGAATGSADVTPIVRKLVRPGSHELYAASSWLEADPAAGTDRLSLSLSYLYQCADHSFTTGEAGAVSYAMLAEHADPSRRARLTGRADFQILHAQYGNRRDFTDVTARIRELMGPDAPPFVVSDPIINGGPHTTNSRFLSITYLYEGRRATFTTRTGQEVRYEQLVENAKHPDDDRIGVVPEWLAIARP